MKLSVALTIIFALAFAGYANATYGVDLSTAVSVDAFRCLVNNGYHFAVVRAGRSNGTPDPSAPQTIKNAWAGGMSHVDAYIFPCPTCGNAAGQIANTVNQLRAHNATIGMLWMDIEGPEYWTRSVAANRAFYEQMVSTARNTYGLHIGVYTSASQWIPIMGGDYTGGAAFALWYAHYDNNPSYSDWRSFGGWSKPSIKQFAGTTYICGAGIDKNWYP